MRARAASLSNGAVVGGAAPRWRSNATSDAASTSGHNAAAFGVDIDVRGEAPDAFDGAEAPSAIFIGGGLTQPGLLDACLDNLPAGGHLVANAVTVESEAVLAQSIFTLRRRAAALPALSRRAARRLHRLATADAGHPVGCAPSDDRVLHRRGPGRRRPDHRPRPAAPRKLPGVPLRGLDHAQRLAGALLRPAPKSSTPVR